jgi:hypothetical protein
MGDFHVDVDSLADGAWRAFREALADAIDELAAQSFLEVALDIGDDLDGAPPYIRVRRTGDRIALEVASNRVLGMRQRLAKRARRQLRGLGLSNPTASTPEYSSSYAVSYVDQVASVAVEALRGAFGVLHPAFLTSGDLTWRTASHLPTAQGVPSAPGAAVYPADREHLDLLVDGALFQMLGHAPHRDSDGDVPIRAGSAVVFVRSLGRAPLIQLFAEMVVEISDLEAAKHEAGVLNRQVDGVKFTLRDDKVIASADVLALPFADEHLLMVTTRMCDVVSQHDKDLARRVGGRTFIDDDDSSGSSSDGEEAEAEADNDIHPVMLCMLQLDATKPGSLRPKDAAKLCGHDSDLLLELIRWNEEQELAWREAREQAYAMNEVDEAEACEHERGHAHRTVKILRKALRRVLLG